MLTLRFRLLAVHVLLALLSVKVASQTCPASCSTNVFCICNYDAVAVLPSDVGLWTQLQYFDLNGNFLTTLPTEFAKLTLLTTLSINDNELTVFPPELTHLSELTNLLVPGNEIPSLPTEIGNLLKLTLLDVTGNKIPSIPTELGRLTHLKGLYMYANDNLYVPTEVYKLTQLTALDTGVNQLTNIPSQIGRLSNLEFLWLDVGQIPDLPAQFASLTNLDYLDLSSNIFATVPASILNLDVYYLSLRDNQLTSIPDPAFFAGLEFVTGLDIGYNQLPFLSPNINMIQYLQYLDAKGNLFTSLPSELETLSLLTLLGMGENQLMSIPTQLGNLSLLQHFNVSHNQLTMLPSQVGKLTSLITFHVEGNPLNSVPTEIGYLSYVLELSLDSNELIHIPTEIGNMQALQQLALEGEKLASIPTEIAKLSNLRGLRISSPNLTNVPDVQDLLQLTSLDVEMASLSSFPSGVMDLLNLEQLTLRAPLIETLPLQFSKLSKLNSLIIDTNKLTTLPSEIGLLSTLTKLEIGYRNVESSESAQEVLEALSTTADISSLTLGLVDCDCTFLSWYPDIADITKLQNIYEAATCSAVNEYAGLYPHILRSAEDAPCTHVTILSAVASKTTISFVWEFLDSELVLDPTVVMRPELTETIDVTSEIVDCSSMEYTVFLGSNLGFQIVWEDKATGVTQVECLWGSAHQNLTQPTRFQYTLTGVSAAKEYEVTMRAFFGSFGSGNAIFPVFGPGSNAQTVATEEDVPDGPPLNLRLNGAEDSFLEFQWDEPAPELKNGEISQYEVELLGETSTLTTTRTHTFRSLPSNTEFSARVRAKTSAEGFGPWSDLLNVTTCQDNTRQVEGSTDCVAIGGYVLTAAGAAVRCEDFGGLIDQLSCSGETGIDIAEVSLSAGYWRSDNTSTNIRECPIEQACIGRSRALNNGSICLEGHEGPLCAVCLEDHFFNGLVCQSCKDTEFSNWLPLIIVSIVAIVGGGVILYSYRATIMKHTRGYHLSKQQMAELGSKFKVLLTTYQIVSTFSWSLEVVFPDVYTDFVDVLLFFTFDVVKVAPPFSCLFPSNSYLTELILTTCLPLIIIIPTIFVLIGLWIRLKFPIANEALKQKLDKSRRRCVEILVYLSFLVYTPVTNKVFRALRPCDDNFDDGSKYMPEDYGINCEGATYQNEVLVLAWTMLAFYCVGVPSFYLGLLWMHKDEIEKHNTLRFTLEDQPKDSQMLNHLETKLGTVSFLYLSYTIWWWEIFEMLRKLTLTGLIVFIAPGTPDQSIVLILLALLSSVLYQYFHPFRAEDNFLGVAASYAVFFIAFASLLLKFDPGFLDSSLLDVLLILTAMSPLFIAALFSRSLAKCCRSCLRRRRDQRWLRRLAKAFPKWIDLKTLDRVSRRLFEDDEEMKAITQLLIHQEIKFAEIRKNIHQLETENVKLKKANKAITKETEGIQRKLAEKI